MSVYEKLMIIQSKLKVPKNQRNTFGNYNYRSCEDILESLKPLLEEVKAIVTLNDKIVQVGERIYLETTATLIDIESGDKISTNALAREDESKKGMDLAQITGSVSSYARKYALNGLFCIDDTKDSDFTNTAENKNTSSYKNTKAINEAQIKRLFAKAYNVGFTSEDVKKHIKNKFGKEIKDLSKQEYDIVCAGYESMVK